MTVSEDPCSICKKPIGYDADGWGGGRNADPVNTGTCCEDCDINVVLPARLYAQTMEYFHKSKGEIKNDPTGY